MKRKLDVIHVSVTAVKVAGSPALVGGVILDVDTIVMLRQHGYEATLVNCGTAALRIFYKGMELNPDVVLTGLETWQYAEQTSVAPYRTVERV